jgi:hypothetical protein
MGCCLPKSGFFLTTCWLRFGPEVLRCRRREEVRDPSTRRREDLLRGEVEAKSLGEEAGEVLLFLPLLVLLLLLLLLRRWWRWWWWLWWLWWLLLLLVKVDGSSRTMMGFMMREWL